MDEMDAAAVFLRSTKRSELDGPRRDQKEAAERRKDKAKLKKRREEEGPDAVFNKGCINDGHPSFY